MLNTIQNSKGYQQNFGMALKPNAIKLLNEAAGKDTALLKEVDQLTERASANKLVHVDLTAPEEYYNIVNSDLYMGPNGEEKIFCTTYCDSKNNMFDLVKKQIERAETKEQSLKNQTLNKLG